MKCFLLIITKELQFITDFNYPVAEKDKSIRKRGKGRQKSNIPEKLYFCCGKWYFPGVFDIGFPV